MRRKDREITESDRIQKIIDACQCMSTHVAGLPAAVNIS